MIRLPTEFSEDQKITCDVVIVGAGPGGGAAAYKLASLGRKVVVLEMGGYFQPGQFTKRGLDALKNLYQDAGQRFTVGNAYFATMFGKGVGGGGLVNSAISFRPPRRVIESWQAAAGLKEFSPDVILEYADEVEKHVNIEVLSVEKLGRNNTIFKDGLEKLGYRGNVIPRNTINCIGCASCFFGCPVGAKQTVDKNFIAKAVNLGTEVYTYAKVSRLFFDSNKKTFESLIATIQGPGDEKPRCRIEVKAKHIILAAGAVGTPHLLIRSQFGNSSGQVGRNFRCHPATGIVGVFSEEINGAKSVVQGYYSDQFIDQDILLETFWAPASVLSIFVPGFGNSNAQFMKDIKHFAGSGAMIKDQSSGYLEFDDSKLTIHYDLNERDQKLLTKGFFHACEVMFAAGAKEVLADNPYQPVFRSMDELKSFFSIVDNLGPDIIREGNHGLGTCRMGENPKSSVVDSFGRCHDGKNVWVMDVSQFPDSLGVNPQITIMSLALRGAAYLDGHFS